MKKIAFALWVTMMLLNWGVQANTPNVDNVKISTHQEWALPRVFMTWLEGEGFRPKREEDEHFIVLSFKYQGKDIQLSFSKDDQQFYNVVDYLVMSSENTGEGGTVSDKDKYLRLQVVNQVTSDMKVVKAYLDEDFDIVLRVEVFDDGTPSPEGVMLRQLDALVEAVQNATTIYWKLKKEHEGSM